MSTAILLSDLIDEWEASMRSNSYAKNTIRSRATAGRYFLAHVGNVQARNVTTNHVDGYFAARSVDLAPSSLNVELAGLRSLFKYAATRRYVPAGSDPTAHRRPARVVKKHRQRIPAHDFPRLLDCAGNPRDRALVAVGLYLFLRRSEVALLKVADLDLNAGTMAVTVVKSSKIDVMPLCAELEAELRQWLTFYANSIDRPLRPDDYLIPARVRPQFVKGLPPGTNASAVNMDITLNPSRSAGIVMHTVVQKTLVKYGLAVREDGASLREGVHTLRRSGARALFDSLADQGYDGAMRTVQSMLHHSSQATTEIYLGVELDKNRRDKVIRGHRMFKADTSNVVSIQKERALVAQ